MFGCALTPHHLAVDVDLAGAVLVRALEQPVGVRRRARALSTLCLSRSICCLRVLQRVDELLVLALGVDRPAGAADRGAGAAVLYSISTRSTRRARSAFSGPRKRSASRSRSILVHLFGQARSPVRRLSPPRDAEIRFIDVPNEPPSARNRNPSRSFHPSPSAEPCPQAVQSTYRKHRRPTRFERVAPPRNAHASPARKTLSLQEL